MLNNPAFTPAFLKAAPSNKNFWSSKGLRAIFHYRDGWAYATDGHRIHGVKATPPVGETNTAIPHGDLAPKEPRWVDVRVAIPRAAPDRDVIVDAAELAKALREVRAFHQRPDRKERRKQIEREIRTMEKQKYPTAKEAKDAADHVAYLKSLRGLFEPLATLASGDGFLRVGAPAEDCPVHEIKTVGAVFTASAWNVGYLLDALALFPRKAKIALRSPEDDTSPVLITNLNEPEALAVVMPVRN